MYKVLIGIEMHTVCNKTNTKVFSKAKNDFCEIPNTNVAPLDLALPGCLPVLNKNVLKMALKMSMILGCTVPEYIYFERKNYYYPDLPKGFQITQETKPAPVGIYGEVEYELNGDFKTAVIDNIHLEEDTAALDHGERTSLVDYNRAGLPLFELVTAPCFHNAEEVLAFVDTIIKLYQYAGISDADPKKGQIRCDVNLSVMKEELDEKDPSNWGTKVEVKNVNSLGGIKGAILYETKRQLDAINNGTYESEIKQETRRWDEASASTVFMRSKANAIDYKYFIEPNIPPFKLDKEFVEEIKSEIPVLANERIKKYLNDYKLSYVDAAQLIKNKDVSDYFDSCMNIGIKPSVCSNWLLTTILGYLNKEEISINDFYLEPKFLKIITDNIESGNISSKQGKEIFYKSLEEKKSPEEFISENSQVSDEDELGKIIDEIIENNKEQVSAYQNGKTNLLGFFVGAVMKKTGGKANPSLTSEIIKWKIGQYE